MKPLSQEELEEIISAAEAGDADSDEVAVWYVRLTDAAQTYTGECSLEADGRAVGAKVLVNHLIDRVPQLEWRTILPVLELLCGSRESDHFDQPPDGVWHVDTGGLDACQIDALLVSRDESALMDALVRPMNKGVSLGERRKIEGFHISVRTVLQGVDPADWVTLRAFFQMMCGKRKGTYFAV